MSKDKTTPSGSRADFPLTAWSVVRQAQALPSAERLPALEVLVRRYWKPIYAYFRSQGKSPADAADLTQAFLTAVLEGNKLLQVDNQNGRFRDWLRACLRNFMRSAARKQFAQKRHPPQGVASLDALVASDGKPFEPGGTDDPEAALEDAWRRDLLDRALRKVEAIAAAKERELDYQIFLEYYCGDEQHEVTWQELAAKYRLPQWKQAARRADWVKEQLAQAIRDEVARYAASEEEIDDEIRTLLE